MPLPPVEIAAFDLMLHPVRFTDALPCEVMPAPPLSIASTHGCTAMLASAHPVAAMVTGEVAPMIDVSTSGTVCLATTLTTTLGRWRVPDVICAVIWLSVSNWLSAFQVLLVPP